MSPHAASLPVFLPSLLAEFRCNERGCCCQALRVPVRGADLERIQACRPQMDLREVAEAGSARGVLRGGAEGRALFLKRRSAGGPPRCVFLGSDLLCELHASCGPEALPDVCLRFPLRCFAVGARRELRFALSCPAVLDALLAAPEAALQWSELPPLAEAAAVALRERRLGDAWPVRTVAFAGRLFSVEEALALRSRLLDVLEQPLDLSVAERIGGALQAFAGLAAGGEVAAFDPAEPCPAEEVVALLLAAAEEVSVADLVRATQEYRPYLLRWDVARLARDWGAWGAALANWREGLLRWVEPQEQGLRGLLQRVAWLQAAGVFCADDGGARFAPEALLRVHALGLRLLAGFCLLVGAEADGALLADAVGLASFVVEGMA